MPTLLDRLNAFDTFTVLLVGDFMLDQTVSGAAERLSPDAPVPVLRQAGPSEDRPGGASNVALCLRGLEGDVICVGVVGDDPEGQRLRSALEAAGCETAAMLTDSSRPTTVKRSFIGLAQHRHPQKMFRVDVESADPLEPQIMQQLLSVIDARIDDADVVCIEDYNKGVCSAELCQAVTKLGRLRGKPVIIDPAAIEDYSKYRGATLITPNRSEAELATGLDTPIDASELHNVGLATRLLENLKLDAVVLTLDRHGALLELAGQEPVLVPTVARSVYDVTGAGDMVLAALAAAMGNGLDWLDAVRFANAAAGLEVEVFGAQPIPLARIRREVLAQTRTLEGKVRSPDELLVELAVHRDAGHRIVLTNGCFDVIHAGHVAYLREARSLGDVLVVGVNSDRQVREQKGDGRPVYAEAERLEILSELASVDYLVLFHEPTAHELIRMVEPDLYVKGGDYEPHEINEYALLQAEGIEVRVLAERPGLSSRTVVERFVRAYGPEGLGSPASE